MKNKFESTPPIENNLTLDVLSKVSEVTDEDIKTFEKQVVPDNIDIFIKCTKDKKIVLALLFKLPDDELAKLVELEYKTKRVMGIHDIREQLFWLTQYTGNNKYLDLTKKHEK